MNTFGLGKQLKGFWLVTLGGQVSQIWRDMIRFSVSIKRKLLNKVEF